MYSCYKLINPKGKQFIIKMFNNLTGLTVVCDHITYQFPSNELPPKLETLQVTGIVHERDVVVGLTLIVNGSDTRPDGKKYHLTIATGPKVRPVYTNTAIENDKIYWLAKPVNLDITWFDGVVQD